MSKYCSQQFPDTPQPLAQHAPATLLKLSKFRKLSSSIPVSCFKLDGHIIDELLNNVDVSPCQGTVQEEFNKYTAALLSLLETDLLHFWEVSYTHIDEDKQH
jgi:hypothetical protein